MKNFVDFLSLLASEKSNYRLAIPVREGETHEKLGLVKVDIPDDIMSVRFYEGHVSALITNLKNALLIKRFIKQLSQTRSGVSILVAGPGPNSTLFYLSLMVKKSVKFVFFIRGDTEKTVKGIYTSGLKGYAVPKLVRLFQTRIFYLMSRNRALAFTYGENLRQVYSAYGEAYSIAPLIDSTELPSPGAKTIVRREDNKGGLFKVLFVGRLSGEKRILELVDACALAKRSGNPFKLSIIGHGNLENQIKTVIDKLDLQKEVYFRGYVANREELYAEYRSHDILCLPSATEGVPRVIVECFAAGLPVAATPVGSIHDLFQESVVMIPDGDPRTIAKTMIWCKENPQYLKSLKQKGVHMAPDFTLDAYISFVDTPDFYAIGGLTNAENFRYDYWINSKQYR
jgi:glycosyltransferase involved in cell wall biosynthesis